MSKPNFFIVGAPKAGTTSIVSYLGESPEVYISPIKEPHFFSSDIRCSNFTQADCKSACIDIDRYLKKVPLQHLHIAFVKDIANYLELFREAQAELAIGEASTGYMYSEFAAQNIAKFSQSAKIIMLLRDPVDRAYSHWKMNVAAGKEPKNKPFSQALEDDFNKKTKGYCRSHLYVESGLYAAQVKRYFEFFPREQILIIKYENLVRAPEIVMTNLFNFLGVKPVEVDLHRRENVSRIIRFPKFLAFAKKMGVKYVFPNKVISLLKRLLDDSRKYFLSTSVKSELNKKFFLKDIETLESVCGIKFDEWKG
ncbi:Sulfotransferase domain protein [Microbulbifer aggregans]|uniref:Sulfotransferase domain protein n=1 Tax=Microbulbifer aggregans TaxID=1769779 RepID=A0A1C9W7T3_9GAMM|nr:sulfotransferase [Microbulbifer aggregans]AOS97198.1 Sulfotransferase domain protein [Microbulbifer aggregans]